MQLSAIELPDLKILFRIPLPFNNPMTGHPALEVPAYGVMMMLGFLAAMLLARRLARRDGASPDVVYNVWFLSLMGGVAGARLFYVIQFGRPLSNFFEIWEGGLVWYGGLFGALTLSLIYIRWVNAPLAKVLDACSPPTMLGLAFGRIGCFLNGCCFGRIIAKSADGPWYGVVYPRSGANGHHETTGDYLYTQYNSLVTVHPAQIYAAVLVVSVCVALLLLRRTRRVYGEQFFLMIVLYAPIRFMLETLRTETAQTYGLGLTAGQWVGALVFLPTLAGWLALRRHGRPMAQYDAVGKVEPKKINKARKRGR